MPWLKAVVEEVIDPEPVPMPAAHSAKRLFSLVRCSVSGDEHLPKVTDGPETALMFWDGPAFQNITSTLPYRRLNRSCGHRPALPP
jgi:hypothetical protein